MMPIKKVPVPYPVPVPVPVLVPGKETGGGGGGGGGGSGGGGGVTTPGSCPRPSPEALKCLQEWACQYVIRLDLRCLLNLNGNPLLGNLISIPGVSGGSGGGGILGNLLGRK
ncbi:uncharacterized protein [Drosophila tropicalis]|uniref:uncharacterized protein n=1 Tax=Drosophila tropicalis TaxID=46794 RepID=UPI0035AB6D23